MDYKTGFNVKPKETNAVGEVTFTDGTYDFPPNQLQCEAYGYTWNPALGTCTAFRYSNKIATLLNNSTNNVRGGTANAGTFNSFLNGESNVTEGNNRNILITGQEGEASIGINNGSIIGGKMGKIIRQGEIVLGGGSYNIGAGYTQSSKMQLSCKTTDETATNLAAQDIDGAYITLQTNSILGLEIYVTRLETGGASGTEGDYSYRVQRAVVRTNDSGTVAIVTHGTTTIGSVGGVDGDVEVVDSTTDGIPMVAIQVADRADVNNLWSATVYLHELRTNIAF
tara:strand:- start:124 stop:969 length:846 start_codon:yes stop_codon:yes gene_type:complete